MSTSNADLAQVIAGVLAQHQNRARTPDDDTAGRAILDALQPWLTTASNVTKIRKHLCRNLAYRAPSAADLPPDIAVAVEIWLWRATADIDRIAGADTTANRADTLVDAREITDQHPGIPSTTPSRPRRTAA